jgi:SAM-dependent methyltransferase
MPNETERVRRLYDEVASRYDRIIGPSEKLLFAAGRRWVCSQVHGDVLEIGVGTGLNLSFFQSDVRLMGIELSPAMLADYPAARESTGPSHGPAQWRCPSVGLSQRIRR